MYLNVRILNIRPSKRNVTMRQTSDAINRKRK